MFIFSDLSRAVIDGDTEQVKSLTQEAIETGISPQEILDKGLLSGMDEVGKLFQAQEMFIPELMISAEALNAGLDMIKPLFAEESKSNKKKVVIGTVQGDVHDIGKSLVSLMLGSKGFQVNDLGIDVSPADFVSAAKASGAQCVAMSAMLTTTMPVMKKTIDALLENGLRDKVAVIVGGAPVTREFAERIGADGYAPDYLTAVETVEKLLSNFDE
ncbi:MAG: corrinoid protein [Bacillota bacterium]